jgi:hypothetical protein
MVHVLALRIRPRRRERPHLSAVGDSGPRPDNLPSFFTVYVVVFASTRLNAILSKSKWTPPNRSPPAAARVGLGSNHLDPKERMLARARNRRPAQLFVVAVAIAARLRPIRDAQEAMNSQTNIGPFLTDRRASRSAATLAASTTRHLPFGDWGAGFERALQRLAAITAGSDLTPRGSKLS